MKKRLKSLISMTLAFVMTLSFSTSAFAAEATEMPLISNIENFEYYESDGTYVEKLTFMENEESAAIIKRTYTDGSFDVEAINGDNSVVFEGTAQIDSTMTTPPTTGYSSRAVTYPYYTDYWYAGSDQYSVNSAAFTAAGIAAALSAAVGIPLAKALEIGTTVYGLCGGQINSNSAYFTTFRYYATLENGPGLPTVWYNKFITYTFSDSGRTNQICEKVTKIYESSSPM